MTMNSGLAARGVRVDIVRDEIITQSGTIGITVPDGVAPDQVARAVHVTGVAGETLTVGEQQLIWRSIEPLPTGRHTLIVDPLSAGDYQRVTERLELPFSVVEASANVPENVRIQSYARILLTERGFENVGGVPSGDGEYIELMKCLSRDSGAPVALAFDRDGRAIDGEERLETHRTTLVAREGKVHPALASQLRSAAPDARTLVDIWFAIDELDPTALRPLDEADMDGARERAAAFRQRIQERGQEILDQRWLPPDVDFVSLDRAAPIITVRAAATSLAPLIERPEFTQFFLREDDGLDDLRDSIAIARSNVVHAAGQDGSGVKVAVWEDGPTSIANLPVLASYSGAPGASGHSQCVHAIIASRQGAVRTGHAPGCGLYSADDKSRDALTWAVLDHECTVVNQSFHRRSEAIYSHLSLDDVYGDWVAVYPPYPLIVHAAGNIDDGDLAVGQRPQDEFVNHKGYNTISVGNHDDRAGALDAWSAIRNPLTPHGDRELPEIAANGVEIIADSLNYHGTSQASPAVAGAAALLQAAVPLLTSWPEACRAILFAAARRISASTWWQDVRDRVDSGEGAGALDAAEAHAIAMHRCPRNSPPLERGWDIGVIRPEDFDGARLSIFSHQVIVPPTTSGPARVKVALAWNSEVSTPRSIGTSKLTVDLDLLIFDAEGNLAGASRSWDNSYEIAEFIGEPGETYTIRIVLESGSSATAYGIAWTRV